MSILGKFFNKATVRFTDWNFPTLSSSGEVVTTDSATSLGIVFACIQVRANAVAKLPLQVFKKSNNGRERVKDHQVTYLLETRPNKHMTPFQFKFLTEAHRLTHGIAYWKMVFNQKGQVIGLHLINPARMTTVVEESGRAYFVETSKIDGQPIVYDEDEIIRLPLFSTSEFEVKSPIQVARENIGVLRSQQKFIGGFYKNGTVGSGIIKMTGGAPLNKDAKEKVRQAWMQANSGLDENSGKVVVLDPNMEYEAISIPLQDAQFIESSNFQLKEIARIFNVPPSMVGDLENSTFNNMEQMSMNFILNTVQPSCIAIEEELNYKLFTKKEQKQGIYVKFNMTSALRGDSASRATFYKEAINNSWMSVNEVRELEELNAIDGGDKHFVSLNYTTLDLIEEYQMAKAKVDTNEEIK